MNPAGSIRTCLGLLLTLALSTSQAQQTDMDEGQLRSLQVAVSMDQYSTVSTQLLRGLDPNVKDRKGNTLLHIALREDAPRVVKLLLDYGLTDVNAINQAGETPLMLAALKGRLPWVKRLVERGALINEPGFTALHYACSGPDEGTVAWLLSQGAELNARSPNGTTPLMMAAGYGSPDSVDVLLKAGADASLLNEKQMSAGDFAERAGRDDLAARLRKLAPAR